MVGSDFRVIYSTFSYFPSRSPDSSKIGTLDARRRETPPFCSDRSVSSLFLLLRPFNDGLEEIVRHYKIFVTNIDAASCRKSATQAFVGSVKEEESLFVGLEGI